MEQNVNSMSEEAAPEEVQVVGNIALPGSSESEQKVVLQPATNCKGNEEDVHDSIALPDMEQNVNDMSEEVQVDGNIALPAISESEQKEDHEEDVHVDITGSGSINYGKVVEDASDHLTDTECSSSSSFGDTGSGIETDSSSELSDSDVESLMSDDSCEPLLLRKDMTTDHWKSYIRPFMLRRKRILLQLKILDSKAHKYEKQLAAYDHQKQIAFSKLAASGLDVKSTPISDGFGRDKIMKRKKRKRVEGGDVSSYMSNHCLFSYYENKDRTGGACLEDFHGVAITGDDAHNTEEFNDADNVDELWLNDVWSSLDHEGFDKSMDDVIQKIEAAQSHVQKLKTRIENVGSENPRKFCSVTHELSMIGSSDGSNQSDHNPASFSALEGITSIIETTNGPQL